MTTVQPGSNAVTVRENNLGLVIRLIHKAKVCSRVDLVSATGLKPATITNIVGELIEWGFIKESGLIQGQMNRRTRGLRVNSDRYRILGVRLDRDAVHCGLFNIDGSLLSRRDTVFSKDTTPSAVMEIMKDNLSLLYPAAGEVVLGIGAAIPGPFIPQEKRIRLMSGFPGWNKIDIANSLHERFRLPVFLEHDANCGVLAEQWYGSVGDHQDVAYIVVDIGVGAGLLTGGKLYTGSIGIAGEVGHMSIDYMGPQCECGNRGCLELYCSAVALKEAYKRELVVGNAVPLDADELSGRRIYERINEGYPPAVSAFGQVTSLLGVGLVNLVNLYNPSLLILSGRFARAGSLYVEGVSRVLERKLLDSIYQNLEIRLGSFYEDSMLYGASALVLEHVLQKPSRYIAKA